MGSYYWACYDCGASNSIRVQRCRACGYERPESLTPPPGVAAVTSEPSERQSSAETIAPDEPQDPLSRLTRWADANPRWLYAAAALLLAPLLLMLLGFNAASALGLWFAALAIAVGVKVYWYSGRSFEADFERLRDEWQKPTATSVATPPTASTTAAPPADAPAPSATTARHEMRVELRCPDCAEDVRADTARCPYCQHRFDSDRLVYCETCDRCVEAMTGGMCPACGHQTSELTQVSPEPAAAPPTPAPAPPAPAPARRTATASQTPVAKGAYWGARLMVVAGATVVIGVFLPWINAYATYEGSVSANGFDLYGTNGELLTGLGVLTVILGLLASAYRQHSAWMRVGAVVAAVVVGIVLVNDYETVQDIVSEINWRGYQAYLQGQGTASASFGLGIPAIGLGVIIAVVGALLGPPRS